MRVLSFALVSAAAAQLMPSQPPGPGWPGATAGASNAAWSTGLQPARLEAWPRTPSGDPAGCWKVSVLHDKATQGWPGVCLNLQNYVSWAPTPQQCAQSCRAESKCSVWQLATQVNPPQCWQGLGGDNCADRKGEAAGVNISAAQRLQHGDVVVLFNLTGWNVANLFNLDSIGSLSVTNAVSDLKRCQAWCYSNIGCEYWLYSKTSGCWVDAPFYTTKQGKDMTKVVQYPLTIGGANQDPSVIAGEYIQHYCPTQGSAPAPKVAPSTNMMFPIIAGLASVLGIIALGLACKYWPKSKSDRRKTKGREPQEEEPFSDDFDMPPAPQYKERNLDESMQMARAAETVSALEVPRITSPPRTIAPAQAQVTQTYQYRVGPTQPVQGYVPGYQPSFIPQQRLM